MVKTNSYMATLSGYGYTFNQINQLLKIFITNPDFDFSGIPVDTDTNTLRGLVNIVKEYNKDDDYLQFIKDRLINNKTIEEYLSNKKTIELTNIQLCEDAGLDYIKLLTGNFDERQTYYISQLANTTYDASKLINEKISGITLNYIFYIYQRTDIDIFGPYFNPEKATKNFLDVINKEMDAQVNIDLDNIQKICNTSFIPEKVNTLFFLEKQHMDISKQKVLFSKLLEKDDDGFLKDIDKLVNIIKNKSSYSYTGNNLDFIFDENIEFKNKVAIITVLAECNFNLNYDFDELKKDITNLSSKELYYYKAINNELNNNQIIQYGAIIASEEIDEEFKLYLLNKNYSFEKTNELVKTQIDDDGDRNVMDNTYYTKLEKMDNINEMHLCRILYNKFYEKDTDKLDYYFDKSIPFDERCNTYINSIQEKEYKVKNYVEEKKETKYNIMDYLDTQCRSSFFSLKDGNIIEVETEQDGLEFLYDDFVSEITENDPSGQIFMDYDIGDILLDTISTFYLKKENNEGILQWFNIAEDKFIEEDKFKENLCAFFFNESTFNNEGIADYTTNFNSFADEDSLEDLFNYVILENEEILEKFNKYSSFNLNNHFICEEISQYYDTYYMYINDYIIKANYGELSENAYSSAYNAFKCEVEQCKNLEDGEVYSYIIYDKDGNEIDSCCGFIGDGAYDEIEYNIGTTFDKFLGNYNNIDELLEALNESKEKDKNENIDIDER